MARLNTGDGHGYADLVVEVLIGLQHPKTLLQNRGDHLLGGGFAHAAGDADHGDLQIPAIVRGDLLQRGLHILNQEDGARLSLRDALGQAAGCAARKGRGNIIVSVYLIPLIGYKKIPGLHKATVDHHTAQFRILIKNAEELPAGGFFSAE